VEALLYRPEQLTVGVDVIVRRFCFYLHSIASVCLGAAIMLLPYGTATVLDDC
jgi:hypothetical protein